MIELKSLTKKFKGITAVDDLNLTIEGGQIFGLLGPNGAGKSTTISLIATLLKPTAGTILYRGADIVAKPQLIQKKIGFVPQEIALFEDLSGLDNLKFWGGAYGLAGANLKERIADVSEIIGIADRLKDRVRGYSGGMKRRLNIGAALLHQPELLIMDEPTVGIDPQSRNHILEAVKQLNAGGVSVIYTSHYMEEVEAICSRIAIIDKGKVIAQGSKAELIARLGESATIILTLAEAKPTLVDALSAHAAIDDIAINQNQLTLHCQTSTAVGDVLNSATAAGCVVQNVTVEQPNLETLFLSLTGKSLRD